MEFSEKVRQPGQGESMISPAAQARLKPVHNASRGLSGVCPGVSLQALKAEVRILVYETPVFHAQRKVVRQHIVGASAIEECAFCLGVRTGHKPAAGARMEDQAPASSQRVRTELTDVEWQLHHNIRSDAVDVGLGSVLSPR